MVLGKTLGALFPTVPNRKCKFEIRISKSETREALSHVQSPARGGTGELLAEAAAFTEKGTPGDLFHPGTRELPNSKLHT